MGGIYFINYQNMGGQNGPKAVLPTRSQEENGGDSVEFRGNPPGSLCGGCRPAELLRPDFASAFIGKDWSVATAEEVQDSPYFSAARDWQVGKRWNWMYLNVMSTLDL